MSWPHRFRRRGAVALLAGTLVGGVLLAPSAQAVAGHAPGRDHLTDLVNPFIGTENE
ncbi:hypothetical protein G3I76_48220, partial [Streptomyces sp. SID11233]|nr:hypothetical protein [Streptomyces sp. SID11233]